MADDIRQWLENLGLGEYADAFGENRIDDDVLAKLTSSDLKDIGVVAVGDRRKLLDGIAALNKNGTVPDDTEAARPPEQQSIAVERRQLTIMFCDLVGSTSLSQQLDPEDLREVMRSYQDAVAGAIMRYGGHVAKYLGDGVLAYFGWPQAYEDQAERSVRAGLQAVENVSALEFERIGPLAARVGIATGQVVVGDLVGEAGRDTEAVTGETPNLAARLQGIAEPKQVIIGTTTRELVGQVFTLDDLGPQELKGFDTPLRAWAIAAETKVDSRFEASHGLAATRFVGRETEQQLLYDRWKLAKQAEGQTILLSGEPGIGKSRMVQAIREHVAEGPHFRLRYQCSPYHTNSALFPIVQRLERAAGFRADDDNEEKLDKLEALLAVSGEEIGIVAPYFANLLSLPWEARYGARDMTPQQIRNHTIEALVGQVLSLSRNQPVLFILEDAHWIDPSTEALLTEIIARTADARVMILITYRPEYQPPWPDHIDLTALTLNRMSQDQGTEIVREVVGDELSKDLLQEIVSRSDGVPLYIEEIAKAVLDASGPDLGQPASPSVPRSLQASLTERLDRLGAAKKVAQAAAVIGREFSLKLISAICNDADLDHMLQLLVTSGLIYRIRTEPEPIYLFKHALVQSAAYESLLRVDRRATHTQIAVALAELYPEQVFSSPELLAHHFTEAGDTENAVEFWGHAGRLSIERSANIEAIAYLDQGLALLSTLPSSPSRLSIEIELQSSLGIAQIPIKGYGALEVKKTYARTRELCLQAGDRSGLFTANWGLWMANQTGINFAEADKLSRELLEITDTQEDRGHSLQAHHAAWTTCFSRGDLIKTLEHAECGQKLYDLPTHRSHTFSYGGHDPGVCGYNFGAFAAWLLGYPERARAQCQEAMNMGEAVEHPFSLGTSLAYSAVIHRLSGNKLPALDDAIAALDIASKHGYVSTLWTSLSATVQAWALAQDKREIEAIDQVQTLVQGKGSPLFRPHYLACLAEVCLQFGQFEKGVSALNEALALVQETGERWWEPEIFRLQGEILAANGEYDEKVEACFDQALKTAHQMSARSLELRSATSLARFLQQQGRASDAFDVLVPVYDWFTEGFETRDLIEAKAILDQQV